MYSLRYHSFFIQLLFALIISTLLLITTLRYSFAENKIYGSLRYDYQNSQDNERLPKIGFEPFPQSSENQQKTQSKSQINNNDSHIGIKGQKDIGNGNAIIYQFEWGNEK